MCFRATHDEETVVLHILNIQHVTNLNVALDKHPIKEKTLVELLQDLDSIPNRR